MIKVSISSNLGKVILDYFYDDNFIVFATGNDNYM